jgi:hypothetical protein
MDATILSLRIDAATKRGAMETEHQYRCVNQGMNGEGDVYGVWTTLDEAKRSFNYAVNYSSPHIEQRAVTYSAPVRITHPKLKRSTTSVKVSELQLGDQVQVHWLTPANVVIYTVAELPKISFDKQAYSVQYEEVSDVFIYSVDATIERV